MQFPVERDPEASGSLSRPACVHVPDADAKLLPEGREAPSKVIPRVCLLQTEVITAPRHRAVPGERA